MINSENPDKNDGESIVWSPNPGSQSLFLSCPYREVFYYGTRKVGKSTSLLVDFLQGVGNGHGYAWRGLLLRRTYLQLSDLATESKALYKKIFPKAEFNESKMIWSFPGGEYLRFSYFYDKRDYSNYHGHFYPWLGWDELCEWPDLESYELMKGCNVSSVPGISPRIRSTANTWGPGRGAVKAYFIDAAGGWGIPVRNEKGHTRIALFGDMLENIPFMRHQGKDFRDYLLSMSDKELVKSWVYGSWDVNIGGFFSDVWDGRKHIIPASKSFIPPPHWYCFRSFDWGTASPFSVGWWCESDGTEAPNGITYPKGALIRFAEWYGNDKTNLKNPNTGIKLTNEKIAEGIREREKQWPGVRIRRGPAGMDIFQKNKAGTSYSIHDMMGGNLFVESDTNRITGWQQMRGRLEGNPDEGPLLYVMERCSDFIRTFPYLNRDDKKLEDIADQQEDHCGDEARYACMHRKRKDMAHIHNISDLVVF